MVQFLPLFDVAEDVGTVAKTFFELFGIPILIIVGVILASVLVNKILSVLAAKVFFLYWPAVAAYCVFAFFMTTRGSGLSQIEDLWGTELLVKLLMFYFIAWYLLIPTIGGIESTDSYAYVYSWGDVDYGERVSYLPGCFIKAFLVLVIAFAFAFLDTIMYGYLHWIPMVLELLWAVVKFFTVIKKR